MIGLATFFLMGTVMLNPGVDKQAHIIYMQKENKQYYYVQAPERIEGVVNIDDLGKKQKQGLKREEDKQVSNLGKSNVKLYHSKEKDKPVSVYRVVYFDFNEWDLREADKRILDWVIKWFKKMPDSYIEIKAYTDWVGNERANEIVAINRAVSVMNYLLEKGINRSDIKIFYYPKCCYVSESDAGKNRRAEIYIKRKK